MPGSEFEPRQNEAPAASTHARSAFRSEVSAGLLRSEGRASCAAKACCANALKLCRFGELEFLFLVPCHYIVFFSSSFIQTAVLNLKSFSLIKRYCPCVLLVYVQVQLIPFILCIYVPLYLYPTIYLQLYLYHPFEIL